MISFFQTNLLYKWSNLSPGQTNELYYIILLPPQLPRYVNHELISVSLFKLSNMNLYESCAKYTIFLYQKVFLFKKCSLEKYYKAGCRWIDSWIG